MSLGGTPTFAETMKDFFQGYNITADVLRQVLSWQL